MGLSSLAPSEQRRRRVNYSTVAAGELDNVNRNLAEKGGVGGARVADGAGESMGQISGWLLGVGGGQGWGGQDLGGKIMFP